MKFRELLEIGYASSGTGFVKYAQAKGLDITKNSKIKGPTGTLHTVKIEKDGNKVSIQFGKGGDILTNISTGRGINVKDIKKIGVENFLSGIEDSF